MRNELNYMDLKKETRLPGPVVKGEIPKTTVRPSGKGGNVTMKLHVSASKPL